MEEVNRDWNFDLYRCIAVLLLVLLHLLQRFPYNDHSILLYFYMLSRPVITMFILISGYFLFQQKEFTVLAVIKRILKIGVPLFFYYTILYIWIPLTGGQSYPYLDILRSPERAGHLWYLCYMFPISILSSFISLPVLDSKKKL